VPPDRTEESRDRRSGDLESLRAIEAVWRIEAARVIGRLARMTGDVGAAEDMAQDALVAALERWPRSGVPENPGAWLTATAKNRAIDQLRRRRRLESRQKQIAHELETAARGESQEIGLVREEDEIEDDMLRLMCVTCHPVLPTEARVALTLRMLGGLSTREIARAYLVSDATMSQRIVRAKRTLAEAQVGFELPDTEELEARVGSVCEVVYLVFNEGYAASAGEEWMRPELCREALRLGRVLVGLLPHEPELHGLVALMEIQMSRFRARVGPTGEPVLLTDQDRARWDRLLAARGLAALERAQTLARERGEALGPYGLQAAIAACHARAHTTAETDWERIVALYDALAQLRPSPVVELNRAVAVAMAWGPQSGLELVDALAGEPALRDYRLLPSVRGSLLEQLGRWGEACTEFQRAAELTRNTRERRLLLDRARACAWRGGDGDRVRR
jgi:RNA polymerase sigma factor (sigma-70 family)